MSKKNKKIITFSNILLIVILVLAFFFKVYRIDSLLGFYFDQGRDALVIWDLWHKGKFFLIGPTTGIHGIFRGPYYYYLIAPFYLIGKGNPIYPSIFLSLMSTVAIYFLYNLAVKAESKFSGLIAVILASFSFNIVIASRWLSNPTPMLFLSVVLIWSMFKVIEGKKWGWPIIALVTGFSLFSFGSSGELYYLLAILLFLIWQWKNRPDIKNLIISAVLFLITFAPLVLFDLRHEGILRNNILKSFVSEKSFTFPTEYLLESRTKFYYEVFTSKIFHSRGKLEIGLFIGLALSFIFFFKKLFRNSYSKILLILLFAPISGLYFYQGNYTVLYDYYMTGYYMVFILLVALILGKLWKYSLGKLFVFLFMIVFLVGNLNLLKFKLSDKVDGPGSIALKNELQVVNWVIEDAEGEDFNLDVYVPPVIAYSYEYLFKWQLHEQGLNNLKQELIDPLYTVYEDDSQHPERLNSWLERQKGIGRVIEEEQFGGITIQKRTRI